jgi:hypothetical protein
VRSASLAGEFWSVDRLAERRRALAAAALGLVAVVWTLGFIALSAAQGLLGWDLRFAYLPAADAIAHGHSPYPGLHDPLLLDQKGYVYPPQFALLLVPLSYLPVTAASILGALASIACLGAILRVLDVRDWRCYAAALLWLPSLSGILFANISLPIALAAAVAWRYRDKASPAGAALGLAVSAKLFVWPLLVWTASTRRLRATACACLLGVGVTALSWAVIGFDGLTAYPSLLRRLNEIQAANSYSFVGISSALGLGTLVGDALMVAVGGGLLVACVVFARREDDRRSFTCAIAATLALSPIVWVHYLVLLLAPVAIARPRLSALWFAPLLVWLSPRPGYPVGYETYVPAIVTAIVLAFLLVPRSEEHVPGHAAAEAS